MKKVSHHRINYCYFNIFKEIPLLLKLYFISRKNNSISNPKKILIVNTCLIGDFIVSMPAIKYFIERHKKSEIDMVVSPVLKPLAECIIGINKVFSSKSVYGREIESKLNRDSVDSKHYDLVLVMRISKESLEMLKNIEHKEVRTYLKPYIKYGMYITKNISKKDNIKQWKDVNFEIIGKKRADSRNFNADKILKFPKKDINRIKNLKTLKNKAKKIIIHTGSGWKVKLWSNEKWSALLERINKTGRFQFVFVGATNEEEVDFIRIQKKLDFKIYSLIKKLNVKETAMLMKYSNYFIGVDEGPRHMAHLVDLPSICLLGPGPKIFKPLSKKAIVIDKSDCRCTSLFCYRKKTCVEKITVNDVYDEFMKLEAKFYGRHDANYLNKYSTYS